VAADDAHGSTDTGPSPGRPGQDPPGSPPAVAPDGYGPLARRVAALESTVAALQSRPATEVRTQRLVVCDDVGTPRIVAEVVGGEARLQVSAYHAEVAGEPEATARPPWQRNPSTPAQRRPRGSTDPQATAARDHDGILLAAGPGCPGTSLGPLIGVQLWGGGNVVATVEASLDAPGPWRSRCWLAEDDPSER
jgi:hypothetical protein